LSKGQKRKYDKKKRSGKISLFFKIRKFLKENIRIGKKKPKEYRPFLGHNVDPEKFKDAVKFDSITYKDVINKGLKIMDMTAFALSQENNLPIIVFDMNTKGNLEKVISGKNIGTIVDN